MTCHCYVRRPNANMTLPVSCESSALVPTNFFDLLGQEPGDSEVIITTIILTVVSTGSDLES